MREHTQLEEAPVAWRFLRNNFDNVTDEKASHLSILEYLGQSSLPLFRSFREGQILMRTARSPPNSSQPTTDPGFLNP
jgi:hypothetical protein